LSLQRELIAIILVFIEKNWSNTKKPTLALFEEELAPVKYFSAVE
jgi:hypothetical protein